MGRRVRVHSTMQGALSHGLVAACAGAARPPAPGAPGMRRGRLTTRLAHLERTMDPEAVLMQGHGLASLLRFAQEHPMESWDLDDLDPDAEPTGLARLLAEARARRERP